MKVSTFFFSLSWSVFAQREAQRSDIICLSETFLSGGRFLEPPFCLFQVASGNCFYGVRSGMCAYWKKKERVKATLFLLDWAAGLNRVEEGLWQNGEDQCFAIGTWLKKWMSSVYCCTYPAAPCSCLLLVSAVDMDGWTDGPTKRIVGFEMYSDLNNWPQQRNSRGKKQLIRSFASPLTWVLG